MNFQGPEIHDQYMTIVFQFNLKTWKMAGFFFTGSDGVVLGDRLLLRLSSSPRPCLGKDDEVLPESLSSAFFSFSILISSSGWLLATSDSESKTWSIFAKAKRSLLLCSAGIIAPVTTTRKRPRKISHLSGVASIQIFLKLL